MNNLAIEKEKKRIYAMLQSSNVSQNKIDALESIIDECSFMRYKLDEAKEKIKSSNVVIPYDNGGGQKGLRENPLFKGYEALFKTYMVGMDKIIATLPKDEQAEEIATSQNDNVLELVRSMHKESV